MNLGIASERIAAIPLFLGSNRINRPEKKSPREKYFLFVGSLETRKNVSGLIEGFAWSGLAQQGFELRIAGGDGFGGEAIRELASRTAGVRLLGFVSAEDKAKLYAHAFAFVYPSFWEGFGLPLLEAMAYGLPCLATETGASPEVGGESVEYIDPCDLRSIGRGFKKLAELSLSEAEWQAKGRAGADRAKKFSREAYFAEFEKLAEKKWRKT